MPHCVIGWTPVYRNPRPGYFLQPAILDLVLSYRSNSGEQRSDQNCFQNGGSAQNALVTSSEYVRGQSLWKRFQLKHLVNKPKEKEVMLNESKRRNETRAELWRFYYEYGTGKRWVKNRVTKTDETLKLWKYNICLRKMKGTMYSSRLQHRSQMNQLKRTRCISK